MTRFTAQERTDRVREQAEKLGPIRRTLCALGALVCGMLALSMGQVFLMPQLNNIGTLVAGVAALALVVGMWRLCALAWNGK